MAANVGVVAEAAVAVLEKTDDARVVVDSGVPQILQNLASSAFLIPHFLQYISFPHLSFESF